LRQAYDYWQDQPGNYFPRLAVKEQQQATKYSAAKGHLSLQEFISDSNYFQPLVENPVRKQLLMFPRLQIENRLVPRSHIIQTHCFLLLQQKLRSSGRTTCNQQNKESHDFLFTKSRWILKCTKCNKLSHQQVVHIPHSLQARNMYLTCANLFDFHKKSVNNWAQSPFQISISCCVQKSIIDSAQDKPANPLSRKSTKAYSIYFSTFV
jgi:hypothetical protein